VPDEYPEYPKINALYMRGDRGKFLDDFARTEFEYLRGLDWLWTEKVDGTNIRLGWEPGIDTIEQAHALIFGRTDNAQIPPHLFNRLVEVYRSLPWADVFDDDVMSVTLYGEGYGARVNKGGGNYNPDGTDFVLFDVLVHSEGHGWWLTRENVEDVADKLGIEAVPVVATCTIPKAELLVCESGFESRWPGREHPEGLVGRPVVDLFGRDGVRLMAKIKRKDYLR